MHTAHAYAPFAITLQLQSVHVRIIKILVGKICAQGRPDILWMPVLSTAVCFGYLGPIWDVARASSKNRVIDDVTALAHMSNL